MIDWDATSSKYGVTAHGVRSRHKCVVVCDVCSRTYDMEYQTIIRNIQRNNNKFVCKSCICKGKWAEDEYRQKQKIGQQEWAKSYDFSSATKKMWQNDDYREKMIRIRREMSNRPEYIQRMRESSRNLWRDPKYRNMMHDKFSSAEYKSKQAENMQRQSGITSSIEHILYSILDDMNLIYIPHKAIGYYSFDCFLPDYNMLIECQGDYWHSLEGKVSRDRSKAEYINRYHKNLKLRYLWEHEFGCREKVVSLIRYWTGEDYVINEFSFDDVSIQTITSKQAYGLLGKYHYIGTTRSHSKHYGAFLNGELIAVSSFGPITRKESATRLGLLTNELAEYTRLCIHPAYQKKNFASWFTSKCLVRVRNDFKNVVTVVAFADHTFNHDGTTYKAGNWEYDGEVDPSYWYIDVDGFVMHKKTLYNRAKKMQITEREFAEKFWYRKVKGFGKSRYLYKLR